MGHTSVYFMSYFRAPISSIVSRVNEYRQLVCSELRAQYTAYDK